MAWRFKASKYKNAALKSPKKEDWMLDLPIGTLLQSQGNHIKSSAVYTAFNMETTGGGSVGILPLNCTGRQGKKVPCVHAHADLVTDLDFSPFDDYMLATCSSDCTVKVWLLPEESNFENIVNPTVSLPAQDSKIENVLWHPTASGVLAASSSTTIGVFDVVTSQQKYGVSGHGDQVQSMSWKGDGSLLLSSCRDKVLRLLDPRLASFVQESPGHQHLKDSRVLWLGNNDTVMSTGFDERRQRKIGLWDTRNFSSCLHSISLDISTGILMPFYDVDTNMIFFAGKGDNLIRFMELTDASPYLTEGSTDRTEQIKGVCIVPKRALDVMNGEVNRLLCLVHNAIIPTPYVVPRKSYRDFHEDLYPDTPAPIPAMTAAQWYSGDNIQLTDMSLNPVKRAKLVTNHGTLFSSGAVLEPAADRTPKELTKQPLEPSVIHSNSEILSERLNSGAPSCQVVKESTSALQSQVPPKSSADIISQACAPSQLKEDVTEQPRAEAQKTKVFTAVRQSKFRHLKGTVLHRSLHIENLRNVSSTVPGESDMFAANIKRCAVPLEGPGGLLSVLELDQPGRLPDTGVPVLTHGSKIMDFVWDPFDDCRLVVACDDAKIRIWNLPESGLQEDMEKPDMFLRGHTEKIYFVRFHPLAQDILASASYDMTVRIWDLAQGEEIMQLEGHQDSVFCLSWSADGKQCATVCKDGKVRIYEPRQSTQPKQEGRGPTGSRGARVVWAVSGKYLVVSGFDRNSVREVSVYEAANISEPLVQETLDINPSISIPFYDEDSSIVFLTGRGDRQIFAFEVSDESPHLFPVAGYTNPTQSQALAFMPKCACDVKKVEFAIAWRLTKTSVEPLSFTVPRVKTEYFQDDLFPATRITWKPATSSSEWLSGIDRELQYHRLCPSNMKPLSEAPLEKPKPKKFESYNVNTYKSDEQKKEELLSAMDKKLCLSDAPMPQDLTEGVDDDEWDDY